MSAENHDNLNLEDEEEGLLGDAGQAKEKKTIWDDFKNNVKDGLAQVHGYAIPLIILVAVTGVAWDVFHIWGFLIYNRHKDDKAPNNCEKPLAVWLGVEMFVGVLGSIFTIVAAGLVVQLLLSKKEAAKITVRDLSNSLLAMLVVAAVWALMHITWWLVGTVWTFQIGRKNHTCPHEVYNFTWWLLTIGWVYYILVAILACMASACLPPPTQEHDMPKYKSAKPAAAEADNDHKDDNKNEL